MQVAHRLHLIQQLLLPLITLVGYVVMAASGQGRNPLLMIPYSSPT